MGVASVLPDTLPPELSKISLQPSGYIDIIGPSGYKNKASWLHFPIFLEGKNMSKSAWNGARLRELREQKGLTQAELAERAGVKRDAVARWEADTREPGWSNAVALAQVLGIILDDFLQAPAAAPVPRPGRPRKPAAESEGKPVRKKPRSRGKGV
jgi:transcriptional regulator with XRE-family HTH domain